MITVLGLWPWNLGVFPHRTSLSWENLLQITKTDIEKDSVVYLSFFVQSNEIFSIISTEVLPYPRKYPSPICVPRAVLNDQMLQD